MADKHKLLVIEDSLLLRLAANKALVGEFPFLQGLAKVATAKRGGCGSCQRGGATTGAAASARAAIAGLDTARRRRFKELLNAHQVRVNYRVANKMIQLTF